MGQSQACLEWSAFLLRIRCTEVGKSVATSYNVNAAPSTLGASGPRRSLSRNFRRSFRLRPPAGVNYSNRRSIASTPPRDRERLCEHRAGEAPRKASLKAGKLVAERLRCHVIAVLGGLPNGVRDRVGLLGGKASAGQPAGDGMGVEHQIRLSRALGWPYG